MSLIVPTLVVIAGWWIGTGAVLYLQQQIVQPHRRLIVVLALLSIIALTIMLLASKNSAPVQSYVGFFAAVVLWGCIELSYYTGLITGIHKRSCPENCSTGRRFLLALGTSIWHEVSVIVTGSIVVVLLLGAENPAGLYSFLVLWLMRWSAKLNLFFGVPYFNTDWFPTRLAYVHSYIRHASVTPFFFVSVLIASFVAYQSLNNALSSNSDVSVMLALPGVLLLLAILEHLFMALPFADTELWNRIFARDEADTLAIDAEAATQSISKP